MQNRRDERIGVALNPGASGLPLSRVLSRILSKASHTQIWTWLATLLTLLIPAAFAQQATPRFPGATIQGTVVDAHGNPVADVLIRAEQSDRSGASQTRSNASGAFEFPSLPPGNYRITAEKTGWISRTMDIAATEAQRPKGIDLVIEPRGEGPVSGPSSTPTMEFSDKPNFTVAGVTDWTAVGGHGSDSTLRTSEAMARDILTLKPPESSSAAVAAHAVPDLHNEMELRTALVAAPGKFESNHRLGDFYLREGRFADAVPLLERARGIEPADFDNIWDLALACEGVGDFTRARDDVRQLLDHRDDASLHRLAGELDEKLGDPVGAVHQYEQAATKDPSELNYFAWGSELLLHRAIWQAQEVFRKGADAYPKSERMLTALGTALFAGAVYDEASVNLCAASDLNPADPEPYSFMGKIEMAAPNPLQCIEPRLARFAREQSDSSEANYLYAMAIIKRHQQSSDPQALHQAEDLLHRAVTLDAKCADAWLYLGILAYERRDFAAATDDYRQAIESNPQLAEAHYRLGVAYDRTGEPGRAKREFELHDQLEKAQAEAVERQRREIQQFLIVPAAQVAPPSTK